MVEVRSDRRVQTALRVAKWASAARSVLCAIETRSAGRVTRECFFGIRIDAAMQADHEGDSAQ